MIKKLLFIFIFLPIALTAQVGTQVDYVDNFGPATCTYNNMIDGKHSYLDSSIPILVRWSMANDRWEIYFNADLLFYHDSDTANPPSTSAGGLPLGGWVDAAPDPGGDGTLLTSLGGTGTTSSLLPIELVDFSSEINDRKVDLSWITASEINNEYFSIEKSADGRDFHEIEKVRGAGDSYQQQTYQFTDLLPNDGLNYYRLRQVDYDGQFSYSPILSEQIHSVEKTINIFPNPSPTGQTQLSFFADQKENVQVNVFNSTTQLVQSQNIDMIEGQNNVSLELEEKGVFYIQVIQKNSSYTKKLIIQ